VNDLSADKLHPTLEEFKKFMNARPKLVLELRESGGSLQDYYNKWIEHGEEDSVWGLDNDERKEEKTNHSDLLGQIMKYTENIDVNKIQGHFKQLNKTLNTVQILLTNFTGQKNPNTDTEKKSQLFNVFRD
jgi:hypothetical protein